MKRNIITPYPLTNNSSDILLIVWYISDNKRIRIKRRARNESCRPRPECTFSFETCQKIKIIHFLMENTHAIIHFLFNY